MKQQTCAERIKSNLKDREEDLMRFYNAWYGKEKWTDEISNEWQSYGLSYDFVEASDSNNQEGYYRFQISWGGPSDEIRFYDNRTEYWFLDWFDSAKIDISNKPYVYWLKNQFLYAANKDGG